jgi:dihydrofolate synthase / folylpolyglutamate synthase
MNSNITYSEMIDHLHSLGKRGNNLGLERMEKVASQLGNPERGLRVIHVAGTNGKGSTVAMLAQILQEGGYSVGTYTSPHLIDFRERIQINGEKISEENFLRLFEKLKETDLTFFEFVTMLAFLYFSEKRPDFVILETGCGGELDATNICVPEISVLTRISLDHQEFLGCYTLEEIAKTKSGIIKNAPVFTCNEGSIFEMIKERCKQQKVNLVVTHDYQGDVSLKGEFQRENAGLAFVVGKFLGVSDENIQKGIANTKWIGRVDWIEKNVLIDGAHNEAGVEALVSYLKTLEYEKLVVVFGVCENKDYKKFLELLPYDTLILSKADLDRAIDPKEIQKEIGNGEIVVNPKDALDRAKEIIGENDLILVTGSLYLIGDLLKQIQGRDDKTINEFV